VLVYLASSDIVVAGEGDVEVALVVAEIEVDFAAVGQDEDLAVPKQWSMGLPWPWWAGNALARVHSPGVDIEVGVDLDRGHLQALRLEQQARGRGCKAARQVSVYHVANSVRTTYNALRVLVSSVVKKRATCCHYEIHTFPTPLITPPETSTYFMIACGGLLAVGEGERRKESHRRQRKIVPGPRLSGANWRR
jgi:hypothetical protein